MAYSDFSLPKVKKDFDLTEQIGPLFPGIGTLEPSPWLTETLATSLPLALASSSEKARSEFIVAPVLLEIEKRLPGRIAIFSGERLDVDEAAGLKGECDFILSKGPVSSTIQAPIFTLVEAKKNDIKEGLGQCVAQMLGARLFNRQEGHPAEEIHGCVTTGEDWQFLKLAGKTIMVDATRHYLSELPKILWIFQRIVETHT